jgi:hypothetical protein
MMEAVNDGVCFRQLFVVISSFAAKESAEEIARRSHGLDSEARAWLV